VSLDSARAGSPSPWLVSRNFDLTVFVAPVLGSWLLAAVSGRLATASGETPTWAWLMFVVGIDVAHVHSTTARVYVDPRERSRRALYWVVPVLAFAGARAAYAVSAACFWRLLAYLAVLHFLRQQVGWLRLYRRRAGERSRFDARLDELTLYMCMLYPLLEWHVRLPQPFHWFMPGDFIAGLPRVFADAARWLWWSTLGVFALRQLQLGLREGVSRIRWGKLGLIGSTALAWYVGIVWIADDFAFTVTNVIAHGVPYMAMSYRVTRELRAVNTRDALPWFLTNGAYYGVLLVGLALAEEWLWDAGIWHEHADVLFSPSVEVGDLEAWIVPLLALPQLVHYLLDAYLWRLNGDNPKLAHALGLRAEPA
jgi:hypothetical protein